MSTWPNRGASGGPCGGLEERKTEANAVRPTRSDSSQQASSKPGAVHRASLRPFDSPTHGRSMEGRLWLEPMPSAPGPPRGI